MSVYHRFLILYTRILFFRDFIISSLGASVWVFLKLYNILRSQFLRQRNYSKRRIIQDICYLQQKCINGSEIVINQYKAFFLHLIVSTPQASKYQAPYIYVLELWSTCTSKLKYNGKMPRITQFLDCSSTWVLISSYISAYSAQSAAARSSLV